MTEAPTSGRVLVKDGKWLVPEAERPANWRLILAEPKESPLDSVIQETENRVPENLPPAPVAKPPWESESWLELSANIDHSAKDFGAEDYLIKCAKVLAAGMFTRTGPTIRKMSGMRNEKLAVERCYQFGLWNRDNRGVVLGNLDQFGDFNFWLLSMVVAGILDCAADHDTFSIAKNSTERLAL